MKSLLVFIYDPQKSDATGNEQTNEQNKIELKLK